jgi:raffinose/stachyose/melibiose transport system permease protein
MEAKKKFPLIWQVLAYIIMIGFTLLTVGPLIWLAYSSFKPHADIVHNIFSLPSEWYVGNYTKAWKLGRMGILAVNSLIYSSSATVCTTLFAMAAGYALSKFGYRISGALYGFFLMGLLLNVYAVLVPLFVMETKLGIDNTRLGVILPYIAFGMPFSTFLAASFIKGLPNEVEEAAIIDGAGYLGVFWHVILPISRPVVATILIFQFLNNWNEFALVFILTSKSTIRTLPVGINAFAGGMTRDYGTQFAALMIGTLPMLVFYSLFNKRLQEGFAGGALKG